MVDSSAAGKSAHHKRPVRLNAFLASAGLGSRRSVEALIRAGTIAVNGRMVCDFGIRVNPERDVVTCDGRRVQPQLFRYVMLHKPCGYTCTRRDPHARHTIYELLPSGMRHIAHAGRLDEDSKGLLLLSNDGAWLNRVVHPRYETRKIYDVEVQGRPSHAALAKALQGVRSRGEWLKVEGIERLAGSGSSDRFRLVLREGRNREIRRIFGILGHPVVRLERIAIGDLHLGSLQAGKWRDLTVEEIAKF
ncbi:MAG: rRNA pseudouridine synthase [Verrucomicrobia bacterium]|nr:rRNA pseudouridine synthase [Verrucomicrobiota bacterium]